jgi:hypothetical protein
MLRLGSRHWIRSKVFLAAAAIAAILLGAGGTALAVTPVAAPVSHGQVNGCYASTGGALRVLTAHAPRCAPGEKSISWPQAPVNGYASTFEAINAQLSTMLRPIATLKLPTGSSYIVSATADLVTTNQTAPFDWAQCEFVDGTKTVIGFAISTIPYDSSANQGFSTLSSTSYSLNGGTITMKCSDQLGQALLADWQLTATQVNRLTLGPNHSAAAPRSGPVMLPSAR